MALFCEGMPCSLCRKPMLREQRLFGTWGIWLPSENPLVNYCDAVLHWDCYAVWEHQTSFARSYFESWVQGRNGNPYWRTAFLNDDVFVEVNPSPPVESAWVYVAATGTRHNPRLEDWKAWLHGENEHDHPLEKAALASVKQVLQKHVPDKESLLSHVS